MLDGSDPHGRETTTRERVTLRWLSVLGGKVGDLIGRKRAYVLGLLG
jgi:hypothetical protein